MVDREAQFFAAVAARRLVRPSVRAIVHSRGRFLVQRPADSPDACFAFIGGEYEVGDTFEDRIRKEFEEETSAKVVRSEYRFVVENRFIWREQLVHGLEHYIQVDLDRDDVVSLEPHLEQHWLAEAIFAVADVRPRAVRDLLASGDWVQTRHLVVGI